MVSGGVDFTHRKNTFSDTPIPNANFASRHTTLFVFDTVLCVW